MTTVALFASCVADQLFPDTAMNAVRLLEAAGVRVEFPAGQTCCGQPALTAGEPAAAVRLGRRQLEVFAEYDAVVAPSGSCVAMMRHHYARLMPDAGPALDVCARTFELTEYLVTQAGLDDVGARLDATVTMHDACHALRNLGAGDAPRALLRRAGATIVEMTEADTCCGFGGVFAVGYPEVSTRLADAKLGHATETRADYLVSTDLACLMHLDGRRRRSATGPRPVHVADLLASGLRA